MHFISLSASWLCAGTPVLLPATCDQGHVPDRFLVVSVVLADGGEQHVVGQLGSMQGLYPFSPPSFLKAILPD